MNERTNERTNELHTFAPFFSKDQILVNVDYVLKNKFHPIMMLKYHHQKTATYHSNTLQLTYTSLGIHHHRSTQQPTGLCNVN